MFNFNTDSLIAAIIMVGFTVPFYVPVVIKTFLLKTMFRKTLTTKRIMIRYSALVVFALVAYGTAFYFDWKVSLALFIAFSLIEVIPARRRQISKMNQDVIVHVFQFDTQS